MSIRCVSGVWVGCMSTPCLTWKISDLSWLLHVCVRVIVCVIDHTLGHPHLTVWLHRYHDTMTYHSQITLNSSLLSLTLTLSLPPTLSHSLPWSIIVFHKPASGKLQNCVRPEIRGIRVDQGREGEGRGSSGSLLCKCIYIDMSQRCANGGFTPP